MASLKDIKRKIKSVKGTQKTTHAMKLVSSAKLKRAEELAKRSKLYAQKISEMIEEIALQIAKHNDVSDNIYFRNVENPKTVDIVFVTADKGLCGGFNSQTIKAVNEMMEEWRSKGATVRLRAIGKKGIAYYRFNGEKMIDEIEGLSAAPSYQEAASFIRRCVDDYIQGVTDKVVVVHNGYVNMITQEIRIDHLVPVDPSTLPQQTTVSSSELELEPDDDDTLLEALLHRYLEYIMYYALIDSLAAEHGARMQAMDAATTNAKEMVKSLTVKYNKARQEAITTELIEIISGVEALK
ncbi:ATP synthase F1 subunit gamma [Nitratifractor sp.]|uniref:ATP synthase F1 subunit gamma n=1 Tax=Nitratifractor sp. TaxID=2268144 RepID=UPI0025FEA135|nr:ATP synthase F1 subunit gamma [Nitratifractor sp.]